MINHDDYDQPLGERPELDLSYTRRNGMRVPVRVALPTDEQIAEWRRRDAELFGAVTKPVEAVAAWPTGEEILKAQAETQYVLAHAHYRPRTRDVVLLAVSLAVLAGTLVYLFAAMVGAR